MAKNVTHWPATGYVPPDAPWLSDDEMARFRDKFVRASADVICTSGGDVLLGLRRYEPCKDWWITGGRMFPHLTPAESAAMHFIDEFRLHPCGALTLVGTYSMCWPNGVHDLSVVYRLDLDDRSVIKPTLTEFSKVKWVPRAAAVASSVYCHQLREIIEETMRNE